MVDRRGGEEEGWVDGRSGARSRHPFDLTRGAYVSDNRASPVFRITSSNDRREFFVRENSTRTGFPRSTIVARSSSSSISSLSLSPRRDRTDGSNGFGRERLFVPGKNYATGRDFEGTVFFDALRKNARWGG